VEVVLVAAHNLLRPVHDPERLTRRIMTWVSQWRSLVEGVNTDRFNPLDPPGEGDVVTWSVTQRRERPRPGVSGRGLTWSRYKD
jgi:hypothetical protein